MIKKLVLLAIVFVLAITISACTKNTANNNGYSATEIVTGIADVKIKQKADKDLAIAQAKELRGNAFQMGEDLSNGPCLSNSVIPDWVADIVHNPRTAVDDNPANQCSAYINGTAHHFVELDAEGNLIRAE